MSPVAFWLGFGVFVASGVAVCVCACVLAKHADERMAAWVAERQRAIRAERVGAEAEAFLAGQR